MIQFRRIEPEDHPLLYAVYRDPAYKEFFRRVAKNLRYQDIQNFESLHNCHLYTFVSAGEQLGFAVVSDVDCYGASAHIGQLVLKQHQDVAPPGEAKVAFQCGKLLLDYIFKNTLTHKVYMRFLANRKDIERTLTLGGFQPEGLKREAVFFDGKWEDELEMSLLRPEYEKVYGCHSS